MQLLAGITIAMPRPDGDGLWDLKAALAEIADSTRPGAKPGPKGPRRAKSVTDDDVTPATVAQAEAKVREVMAQHGEPAPVVIQLRHATRVRAILQAARDSIEIQKLRGELISVGDATKGTDAWVRELRQVHLEVPPAECDALAEAMLADCTPRTARRELERIMRALCERMSQRAFRLVADEA